MKGMMTEDAVKAHVAEFHPPDEPVPSMEQVAMMIEQGITEGEMEGPKMSAPASATA